MEMKKKKGEMLCPVHKHQWHIIAVLHISKPWKWKKKRKIRGRV
jgi:hypothetical protein